VARGVALAAVLAASLLAVSGAGGTGAQTPSRGGAVVVAVADTQEPACLNPLLATCFFTPGARVLPGAFEVGPDLTYRPNLVSRVDVVSRNPQTLVYHIRPQARWSDGQPLTARDFLFTFRAFTNPKLALPPAPAGDFGEMRRVEPVDSQTLRVVLRDRDPEYRRLFPLVLPRHALVGADLAAIWRDRVDDPRTGRPIGSGPFLVAGFDRGEQLNLVRNPRYWGPHTAFLDRLVYRFSSSDELIERFRNGQVDVLSGSVTSVAAFLALRKERPPGSSFLSGPGTSWEHFEINTARGHPALRSKLVRQALAYGIDRDAIARRVLGGLYGEPPAASRPLQSVVFLATSPYYKPHWEAYRYRPGVARRLLERAGCRLGADRTYVCAGNRLSLRFVTTAGVERRELAVTLVQSQLRRIGVEVLPVFIPSGALLGCQTDCVLVRGDFDLALFAWVYSAQLLTAAYSLVCQFGGNFSGYCDRLITRDFNQIWGILDLTRRVQRLNGIDARLASAVPWIPLFQVPHFVALRRNVEGVVINPGDPTWNAENWWLER
jgi:peptide/nickel transport system substrate-binding protein